MEQIICLSTSNYNPYPTRKQNAMNRLAEAEILYFDPPVTYLAPLKDKSVRPRLRKFKQPGEQVKDNITVYALPPVWPWGINTAGLTAITKKNWPAISAKKLRNMGLITRTYGAIRQLQPILFRT